MGQARAIRIALIDAKTANLFIKAEHYSGKVVPNSQLHFGVFLGGSLEGVMQFGPPLCRANMLPILKGVKWHDMIELNRMAFREMLPRNSESRAIAFALRMIKRHKPNMEMVLSFADGCQCGDGAIYRATGFLLTDIKKNTQLRVNPADGQIMHKIQAYHKMVDYEFMKWKPIDGYQLRYIYLYNPKDRERLTVPVLPYGRIKEMGIGMYKGEHIVRCKKD